jgi:sRNA-binding regulator protein Hfq
MDGNMYIDTIIRKGQPVMIRLLDGRDISAVPMAQDGEVLIIKNPSTGGTSMIYKKAISVITPLGG